MMAGSTSADSAAKSTAGRSAGARWIAVCRIEDVEPERGVAVLVDGRQVALFRTFDGDVYALDHLDPFSGAHVMARGIVGSRGDVATVASPMYKQAFDLRTGVCLDDPSVRLTVHDVQIMNGVVEVALGGASATALPAVP